MPVEINNSRENEPSRLYFAYGSNMDSQQMAERCPGATIVGKGKVAGYRFVINTRGVATIVPDKEKTVYGLVWLITGKHEVTLDKCEGVKRGNYAKQDIQLEMDDGSSITALIYIDRVAELGIPRNGYLEKIVTAAKIHEFSSSYLEELTITTYWRQNE